MGYAIDIGGGYVYTLLALGTQGLYNKQGFVMRQIELKGRDSMKKLFVIGLVLLSFGCIRVQSYVKPDANFSNLKKVALIKFGVYVPFVEFKSQSSQKSDSQGLTKSESQGTINISPQNESLSNILTDAIALAFIKKDFNVIT